MADPHQLPSLTSEKLACISRRHGLEADISSGKSGLTSSFRWEKWEKKESPPSDRPWLWAVSDGGLSLFYYCSLGMNTRLLAGSADSSTAFAA